MRHPFDEVPACSRTSVDAVLGTAESVDVAFELLLFVALLVVERRPDEHGDELPVVQVAVVRLIARVGTIAEIRRCGTFGLVLQEVRGDAIECTSVLRSATIKQLFSSVELNAVDQTRGLWHRVTSEGLDQFVEVLDLSLLEQHSRGPESH